LAAVRGTAPDASTDMQAVRQFGGIADRSTGGDRYSSESKSPPVVPAGFDCWFALVMKTMPALPIQRSQYIRGNPVSA
jgi:hypothetical protein